MNHLELLLVAHFLKYCTDCDDLDSFLKDNSELGESFEETLIFRMEEILERFMVLTHKEKIFSKE